MIKAWCVYLWDAAVFVAATTRAKAKYIVAKMAADAWYVEVGEALPDARVIRAPEWDDAAATKGEPGSLHPLRQWRADPDA